MSSMNTVPRKLTLLTVPSGEIRVEDGSDGTYLLFDCDCLDALPICRAQCCALVGTVVLEEETEALQGLIEEDFFRGEYVMKRDADGRCTCLNRETKTCEIYDKRPLTCQKYHCTKGNLNRGWKLANHVTRQSE